MKKIKYILTKFFESKGIMVCHRLGRFLGIRTGKIRVFFLYFNFFSLGIGFLVYLWLALFLFIKDTFWIKRKSAFDL